MMTKQGVRDLNSLGGKRVNGKKPPCRHPPTEVFVSHVEWVEVQPEFETSGPTFVPKNILGCDLCGEEIGPESRFDVRPGQPS